jgi:hypothetical protein
VNLRDDLRSDVLDLYRALGGRQDEPFFRPGAWALAYEGGILVELDEELHFNRYRAATLQRTWSPALPWQATYLGYCRDGEARCLGAAKWGSRWTSPPSERLLGSADEPGTFGDHGAPRWKQRALYDTVKDAFAVGEPIIRLVRLSVHDELGVHDLDWHLNRREPIEPDSLHDLIETRTLNAPDPRRGR